MLKVFKIRLSKSFKRISPWFKTSDIFGVTSFIKIRLGYKVQLCYVEMTINTEILRVCNDAKIAGDTEIFRVGNYAKIARDAEIFRVYK